MMIFSWDDVNRAHIAKHGVAPEEAEWVVSNAEAPFPETVEEDKLVVWGATEAGRFLQVVYVLKSPGEIAYESIPVEDWINIESDEAQKVIRIIHAMDLTPRMKRRLRRRWR